MEPSKLAPQQSYWKELFEQFDEAAVEQKVDGQIAQQRRAITLAGRVLVLRNMPGFQDFERALRDIREHTVSMMVTPNAETNAMLELKGQIQAYDNILAVMERGETRVKALEDGLRELENRKVLIARPKKQEAVS